ncbi:MAG: hypothetical protein ACXADX_18485 [Candidatus Hodarchaeales archaeon]
MSKLPSEMYQVHEILDRYLIIHDKIFKFSLSKTILFSGLFKRIDYGQHLRELGSLVYALEQVANSSSKSAGVPNVFRQYVMALLKTMQFLRDICKKLYDKSQGHFQSYTTHQYKSDVAMYRRLVEEYRSLELALNKYIRFEAKDLEIASKGMASPKEETTESNIARFIAAAIFNDIKDTYDDFVGSLEEVDPLDLLADSYLYYHPDDMKEEIAIAVLYLNQELTYRLFPADQAKRLSALCFNEFMEWIETFDREAVTGLLNQCGNEMDSPPIPPPPENLLEPLAAYLYQSFGINPIYSEELDQRIPSSFLVTVISEYVVSFMVCWNELLEDYEIISD